MLELTSKLVVHSYCLPLLFDQNSMGDSAGEPKKQKQRKRPAVRPRANPRRGPNPEGLSFARLIGRPRRNRLRREQRARDRNT